MLNLKIYIVVVLITILLSENSSPFCQFLDGCYCMCPFACPSTRVFHPSISIKRHEISAKRCLAPLRLAQRDFRGNLLGFWCRGRWSGREGRRGKKVRGYRVRGTLIQSTIRNTDVPYWATRSSICLFRSLIHLLHPAPSAALNILFACFFTQRAIRLF